MSEDRIIEILLSLLLGIVGYLCMRANEKIDRLELAMESRVSFAEFGTKSNFLHGKINGVKEDHGERLAVLEDRSGIERKRRNTSDPVED